jgi:hypothetical protein
LHSMKVRLERGRLNKAQRGELFHDVPVGYMLDECTLPMLNPDQLARHVMTLFFELFQTLGSSNALFHYLAEHNIRLPSRNSRRDLGRSIDWRLPAKTTVSGSLQNPLYAGAYGYGRVKRYGKKYAKQSGKKHRSPERGKCLSRISTRPTAPGNSSNGTNNDCGTMTQSGIVAGSARRICVVGWLRPVCSLWSAVVSELSQERTGDVRV